jgi:hypothetical protein
VRRKTLARFIAFNLCVAAALAALLFAGANRTELIVWMGVRGAGASLAAARAALALAFLAGNALLGRGALREARASKPAREVSLNLNVGQNRAMDPPAVRQELLRVARERPRLARMLHDGALQLDSMDRKQAKLKEILRNSSASAGFAREIPVAVDETEQLICQNLAKVLNRAVLWDPNEAGRQDKAQIYEGHLDYIARHLARNEDALNACDALLAEMLNYMDERGVGGNEGAETLAAMTEALQNLRGASRRERA